MTTGQMSSVSISAAARRLTHIGVIGVLLILFAACSNTSAPEATQSPDAEETAPDLELTLFENEDHERGETLRLSDLEGRPVVINFWFPSCPPCVAEMPDIEAAYQKHKGSIEFVGIQLVGLDTVEDGQEFVDDLNVNYALGPDESGDIITKDYKVPGFPTTVFLNADHTIARTWTGILNEQKLEELLAEIQG